MGGRSPDPRSEIRNPKEIRDPKPEWRPVATRFFGLRPSGLFRISDFGLRISRSRSHVPAIPRLVFRVTTLKVQARLLVAFLVQVVEKRWVGGGGKLASQLVEPGEQGQEAGLGVCRGHPGDGGLELN